MVDMNYNIKTWSPSQLTCWLYEWTWYFKSIGLSLSIQWKM